MGKTYYDNYEVNQAFINQQLDFIHAYEKQISPRYISDLYFHIGSQYYEKGSLDSSILFLRKGLVEPRDYYTTCNNGMCHYMLSVVNMNTGRHEQSIEDGLKAQKEFEIVGDFARQSDALDAIASLYRISRDYTEAIKVGKKAYEIALLSKNDNSIVSVSINRLSLYNGMEHPDFGQFVDTAVLLVNKLKDITEEDKLMIYSYKIIQLTRQKKLKEAHLILEKYKDLYERTTFTNAKEHYELALAEYEVAKGRGSSNIKRYEKLISDIKKERDFVRLAIYYKILKDDAVLQNDYKKAYGYQSLLEIVEDSVSNIKLKAKVKELDKKYQTEKKEQLIKLQEAKLKQNKTLIYALISSMVGLFFLIFAYYLWQKQKTLKQQKVNSMNFTKQLLENTEEERKRIASDLHDSISHELLSLKSMLRGDFMELNAKVDTIINDIRGISRNLHPVMFDKIGLEPNIEQLVERIQQQNDFMVTTEINYKGSLSSANELQIYRIIQEALTNIIKYAKAHAGKITIEENKEQIFIEIKDNGKGFNVKEALNSGKSFGLHNIIERSRVVGGEAKISSSTDGTVIHLNIPKKA